MNDNERDSVLTRLDTNVASLVEARGDHETRIRTLEAAGHNRKGAIAMIAAVCSGIWALLLGCLSFLHSK